MALTLPEISRLSRQLVADSYAAWAEVEGVAQAEAGSEYAELVLTVRLPSRPKLPRTLLVQVRRSDAATLQSDLRRRLARALKATPLDDDA